MADHGGNGPRCRKCGATEARCAFVGGCCTEQDCSHFGHLDENGDDRHGNRPDCSTEAGYQSHRYRREAACEACKAAHNADVQHRNRLQVVA